MTRPSLLGVLLTAVLGPAALPSAAASDVGTVAAVTSLSTQQIVARASVECTAAASFFGIRASDAGDADALMAGTLRVDTHPDFALPPAPTWDELGDGTSSWRFYYGTFIWLDVLRREGLRRGSQPMLDRYAELWHAFISTDTSRARWVWTDMADGLRTEGLACAISALGATDELVTAMAGHAQWLDDPAHYVVVSNHAMHQNSGLFVAGYVLGNDPWLDRAIDRQTTVFAAEIDDAGGNTEGSVMYTVLNKDWMDDARRMMTAAHVPLPDAMTREDHFADFVGHATTPDGHFELLGDTSYTAGMLVDGTRVSASLTPFMTGTVAEWSRSQGSSGTVPTRTLASYPTGFLFQRSGWGTTRPFAHETAYSVRYGVSRQVAMHSHQDAGSITLYSHGAQLLWDQGMYDYNGGAMRVAVMSAPEHNRVTVDGLAYSRTATSPMVVLDDTARSTLSTVKVTDMPGVTWYRTVLYSKRGRYLVVMDSLASPVSRTFTTNWHLGIDREILFTRDRSAAYTSGSGANASLFFAGTGAGTQTLVRGQRTPYLLGWRSLARDQAVPSPVVRSSRTGTTATFVTVVVPRAAGQRASAVGLSRVAVTPGEATLTLRDGVFTESVSLTPTAAELH